VTAGLFTGNQMTQNNPQYKIDCFNKFPTLRGLDDVLSSAPHFVHGASAQY
jgi:hypothetical protein